jgi:hypothetical protein
VQLAYNVDRLTSLSRELRDVIDAKRYAEDHNNRYTVVIGIVLPDPDSQ